MSLKAPEKAWKEIVQYAQQPDATVTTAQEGSENRIGVDTDQQIFFRKDGGTKRKVDRSEFNRIWRTLQEEGEITRKQVGDITSDWAGAALFGAIDAVFDLELDLNSSPIRLHRTN